ncbi:APC family permease [Klebsiella variicola]
MNNITNTQEIQTKTTLKKALSFNDLVIYGMVFMIPIAPFAIYGYVSDASNGMVPLAYLIGMIAMFFTAWSYKTMSCEFPVAGSVYSWAGKVLGKQIGFAAGWLLILDYLLIPALTYVIAAAALNQLFPLFPRWLWILMFLGIGTVSNVSGIEITARVNKVFLTLQLLILAVFIVLGIMALEHGAGQKGLTFAAFYQQQSFHLGMVFTAVSVCALSFLGFDAISTLTEEVRGDTEYRKHLVGKATLCSLVVMGALFILQTWVAAALADGMHFSSPDNAFYEIATIVGGKVLAQICAWMTAIMFGVSCSLASQAAISRLLFSMARDKCIPAIFSKVHHKYGTPWVSILIVGILSLFISLAFIDRIDDLASFVNFGALSGFLLLHISVIAWFMVRKKSHQYIQHLFFPLLGALIIGYVLYSMGPHTWELGVMWLLIGLVYYFVMTRIIKQQISLDLEV